MTRLSERGPERSALSFVLKLAVAGVGKRPQEDAGVLIDRLANVHGEGENHHEKEKIYAKERMQQSAESFRREQVNVHPYERDDGE